MKNQRIVIRAKALILCGMMVAAAQAKPNIIFILTDDQGYGDLSCHGNPILRTPNLDRLHGESVRFTDFHVSPSCSPTRSALLTGRHEFKNGVTGTKFGRERPTLTATTLPQALKSAGYATGIFGKWHLGDEAEYRPNRRGFDEVFIHGGGSIGQRSVGGCGDVRNNSYFDPVILHNDRFVQTAGYCTDVFFAQAIRWMDTQRQDGRRFYAYIACNTPHAPFSAKPEDAALYNKAGNKDRAHFFGMIHNIDENVGRLLAKLEEWNLTKETLVVFMNDNGGTRGVGVYNAGMRGGKGRATLGGTRAISFWRWPGTFQPADIPSLAAHVDFFPTIAAIAGAQLDEVARRQIEGRSLVPLLKNPKAPWPDRTLFTHLGWWPQSADPEDSKYKTCAVRDTRWHLVSEDGDRKPNWRLFDVPADPGESRDVSVQNPEVVQRMAAAYEAWWKEVKPMLVNENAGFPQINVFEQMYQEHQAKR